MDQVTNQAGGDSVGPRYATFRREGERAVEVKMQWLSSTVQTGEGLAEAVRRAVTEVQGDKAMQGVVGYALDDLNIGDLIGHESLSEPVLIEALRKQDVMKLSEGGFGGEVIPYDRVLIDLADEDE